MKIKHAPFSDDDISYASSVQGPPSVDTQVYDKFHLNKDLDPKETLGSKLNAPMMYSVVNKDESSGEWRDEEEEDEEEEEEPIYDAVPDGYLLPAEKKKKETQCCCVSCCVSCYAMLPYKTWKSVLWFVATWLLTIGLVVSVSTSYWLIGPPDSDGVAARFGFIEDCSVSTSNDSSSTTKFSCSGLRTNFQPLLLLVVMCILGVGVFSLTFLTLLTLIYCFCDQLTACGRSFHTLAGIWQATASLVTLVGVGLFPVLWEDDTITNICKTSQIFELGECSPGFSLYLAVACCFLGYIVAGFSLSLDKSTFRVTRFDSMESLDTYKQSGY